MIYKLNNGGIIKLQKAGSVPEYGNIEQIAKYNREHGTHFWKMSQVLEHDKQQAQQKTQDKKKSFWEILAGHPESSGEAILNKTIETANNTKLPETRKKIYNDVAKSELGTVAASAMTVPLLGEFTTYGLWGGLGRIAGGFGGSAVGSWGLGKAGDWADKQFGTNWMGTTGRIVGGFAGWPIGSNIGYKGALDFGLKVPQIAKIGATNQFAKDAGIRGMIKEIETTSNLPTLTGNNTIKFTPKQTRVISEGTYPLYTGPQHSISEIVNLDGTINPRAALRIQREIADNIPGAYRMETRLENPEWHLLDPTTWDHTKQVAKSAWTIPTPKGFTKQDQMVAALGHDFGKIVAGEGHGPIGADLISQIFPDATTAQLTAIREHMGMPKTPLGLVTKQADILNGQSAIIRTVQPNGKIRLSLPSHTDSNPRQFVLEPQGNNKFYVHMRTWDGDHIPANLSPTDKTTLFNALYEELPEGAEILFPQSGPGNYATRGTVAGLQHLARDSRFRPGSKGILKYVDKDGTIKTFEGSSFIKWFPEVENGYKVSYIIPEAETNLEYVEDFINNDMIPRLLLQGHYIDKYTPRFRVARPQYDAVDAVHVKSPAGAWFTPMTDDITVRGNPNDADFGLLVHESNHGIRYHLQPDYKPTTRENLNAYIKNEMTPKIQKELLDAHAGTEVFNKEEIKLLEDAYPWVKDYPGLNERTILHERGAINSQFRGQLSNKGNYVSEETINNQSSGSILRKLIDQPYTSSITKDLSRITGLSEDEIQFMSANELEKFANNSEIQQIITKIKKAQHKVGMWTLPVVLGSTTIANQLKESHQNNGVVYRKQGGILKAQKGDLIGPPVPKKH